MISNLIIDSINKEGIVEFQKLEIDGLENVFIFFRNIYNNSGNIKKSFLETVKEYYDKNYDYIYKNIIVLPEEKNNNSIFRDNVLYILWFSKNDDSFFNKDAIREPHIWKDVEWGKRKKNYSENGKDPSNVWIPTKDDGKGKITEHIYIKIEGAIDRIYDAFTPNAESCNWYYLNHELSLNLDKEIVKKELRKSSNNFLKSVNLESEEFLVKKNDSNNIQENKVIFGTSEKINEDSSMVDLVVTSPPYWNLKDYFKKGQIGQESYEDYLSRLEKVWKECIRLMKPDTLFWININIRRHKKNPYFLPSDYISQFKNLGMHFKEVFIWHKSSSIPTTNKNLSDKFEVFLVFSNSEQLKIDKNILLNFNEYKCDEMCHGTIWNVNRKAGSIGKKFIHPAIFPTHLIERVISVSTQKNNLVLDPFLGSGTTGIAALNMERYFLGVEYNEDFRELMEYRFGTESNSDLPINYIYTDKE